MYRVESNRTLDFGLAIMRVVRAKEYAKDIKEYNIQISPEIECIVKDMLERISVAKMDQLKKFVATYYFDHLLIDYAYDNPSKSLDELFETFEEQNPEMFLRYLQNDILRERKQEEITEEAVKEALEKINANNTVQLGMSFRTYRQIKANPKEAQDLFLECIRYFKPIYILFSDRVEAIRVLKTPVFEAKFKDPDAIRKFESMVAFNDAHVESFQRIVYLSVFSDLSVGISISKSKERFTVVFGISLETLFDDRNLDHEVLKCLADPTKMEMLKIIGAQDVCAKDLVGLLKLSKSNISHHIGKLTYAELITIQVKEGNRAYYALNSERIEAVFERILSQLKRES